MDFTHDILSVTGIHVRTVVVVDRLTLTQTAIRVVMIDFHTGDFHVVPPVLNTVLVRVVRTEQVITIFEREAVVF